MGTRVLEPERAPASEPFRRAAHFIEGGIKGVTEAGRGRGDGGFFVSWGEFQDWEIDSERKALTLVSSTGGSFLPLAGNRILKRQRDRPRGSLPRATLLDPTGKEGPIDLELESNDSIDSGWVTNSQVCLIFSRWEKTREVYSERFPRKGGKGFGVGIPWAGRQSRLWASDEHVLVQLKPESPGGKVKSELWHDRAWDRPVRMFEGPAWALSPSGRFLVAMGPEGKWRVERAPEAEVVFDGYQEESDRPANVSHAYSPSERILALRWNKGLYVIDVERRQLVGSDSVKEGSKVFFMGERRLVVVSAGQVECFEIPILR